MQNLKYNIDKILNRKTSIALCSGSEKVQLTLGRLLYCIYLLFVFFVFFKNMPSGDTTKSV